MGKNPHQKLGEFWDCLFVRGHCGCPANDEAQDEKQHCDDEQVVLTV